MPTEFQRNTYYQWFYKAWGNWFVVFFIPVITMVVFNVVIIKAVHAAYRVRKTLTSSHKLSNDDR